MADLDKMARELLASCLDDWGHPTEAQNVRSGEDLESYDFELRLIEKLHAYGLLRFAHEPVTAPPGYVMVPAELAGRLQASIGAFVSDEGWGAADMGTADDLSALLAAAMEVKW